ncbi:MAG: hypothetical protein ACREEG_04655, partial [Phenylobacterium sp.]
RLEAAGMARELARGTAATIDSARGYAFDAIAAAGMLRDAGFSQHAAIAIASELLFWRRSAGLPTDNKSSSMIMTQISPNFVRAKMSGRPTNHTHAQAAMNDISEAMDQMTNHLGRVIYAGFAFLVALVLALEYLF